MLRGLNTLWYMRSLHQSVRYGRIAWMLVEPQAGALVGILTLPLAPIGTAPARGDPSLGRRWLAVLGELGRGGGVLALRRRENRPGAPARSRRRVLARGIGRARLIAWVKFFQPGQRRRRGSRHCDVRAGGGRDGTTGSLRGGRDPPRSSAVAVPLPTQLRCTDQVLPAAPPDRITGTVSP